MMSHIYSEMEAISMVMLEQGNLACTVKTLSQTEEKMKLE